MDTKLSRRDFMKLATISVGGMALRPHCPPGCRAWLSLRKASSRRATYWYASSSAAAWTV